MHPLLINISKVIICSGILTAYYWLFLRNKIFHHYNRFYLLIILILSVLLPFIQINFWQPTTAQLPVIKMLQAVDSSHFSDVEMIAKKEMISINWALVFGGMYILVCLIFLYIFTKALFKIYTLYKGNIKDRFANIQLIHTDAAGTPFSFLKTIFWNIHIDVQSHTGQQILKHEIAHVQQKHSYDKLLTNLLLIVYWINPFFWLIRSELNMIHEFVADKKAIADGDTHAFATMILKATYPTQQFTLTNNFFYSPIKRRIMMITKNTPNSINYASRLMAIPIAACLFIAFAFKPIQQFKYPVLQKKYTVVIDAGHGGKDLGAASKTGMYEKDLTLQLAKKIKALNTNSNINIILTRDNDVYASPKEKAEFVNAQHADAMISIHVDFAPDSADIKSGSSFWVTKDEFKNTNTSKAFANTLIQSFDKDYTLPILSNAPLQRNVGIWILQASNCPAVLIEAGFLSNKKDVAFLQSNNGQQAFAKNILNGIERYFALSINEKVIVEPAIQNDVKIQNLPILAAKKNTNKLLVVDGKIISDIHYLSNVTKNNIEMINIIDAKKATSLYGEKGKNGAIIVYTKKLENKFIMDSALIIINNEIIGNSKALAEKLQSKDLISVADGNIDLAEVKPLNATKKYEEKGQFGAYEIQATYKKDNNIPTPLYTLNGKIITPNEAKKIVPNDIATINVLKGNEAIKIYGTLGKDGVVEVVTKSQKR